MRQDQKGAHWMLCERHSDLTRCRREDWSHCSVTGQLCEKSRRGREGTNVCRLGPSTGRHITEVVVATDLDNESKVHFYSSRDMSRFVRQSR